MLESVWRSLPTMLFVASSLGWLVSALCAWFVAPGALGQSSRTRFSIHWVVLGFGYVAAHGAVLLETLGDGFLMLVPPEFYPKSEAALAGVALAVCVSVIPRPNQLQSYRVWEVSRATFVALAVLVGVLIPDSRPWLSLFVGVCVGLPILLYPDWMGGDNPTQARARIVRSVGVSILTIGVFSWLSAFGRHNDAGETVAFNLIHGLVGLAGAWYVLVSLWLEFLRRRISVRVRKQKSLFGLTPAALLPVLIASACVVGIPLIEVGVAFAERYLRERAIAEATSITYGFRWKSSVAELLRTDGTVGRARIGKKQVIERLLNHFPEYIAGGVWVDGANGPVFLGIKGVDECGNPIQEEQLYQPALIKGVQEQFAWVGRESRFSSALVVVSALDLWGNDHGWHFSVLMDARRISQPIIVRSVGGVGLMMLTVFLITVFCLYIVRSRNESELRAHKEQAEAEVRARNQLIGVVSHELRTPLQSIIGFAELMSDEALSPLVARQVRAIRSQGTLLLRMVQDILDFTSMETGQEVIITDAVILDDLWADLRAAFSERAASKGIEFEICADEDLPFAVMTDRLRVSQLLVNLVANAVKFTSKGSVRVSARNRGHTASGKILLELEVSDSGPGLSASQARRAFEPFRKLRGDDTPGGGGVGLGLAICRQIVTRMGGEISVTSNIGEGSVFTVQLRVNVADLDSVQAEADRASVQQLKSKQPLAGLRVLVVDDNPFVRELLREFMHRSGAIVNARPDGRSAMQVVSEMKFDVILLDVRLPDIDGRKVAAAIRAHSKSARDPWVIAISAGLSEPEIDCIFDAGFNEFLLKPVSMMGLAETIRMSPAGDKVDLSSIDELEMGEPGVEARQAFFGETLSVIMRIESLAQSEDSQRTVAEAHYLANGCMTFGLEEAFGLCRQIETLAESGNWSAVLDTSAQLRGSLGVAARSVKA